MSTTAEKASEKKTESKSLSLLQFVGTETLLLADVISAGVPELEIAKAWAAGEIEFGRRSHCVTGPAGKDGSALVIEDGMEWSGPKTKMHKGYRELSQEQPPAVRKYKKYVQVPPPTDRPEDPPVTKAVDVPADEALSAIALHVRLTDKGIENS